MTNLKNIVLGAAAATAAIAMAASASALTLSPVLTGAGGTISGSTAGTTTYVFTITAPYKFSFTVNGNTELTGYSGLYTVHQPGASTYSLTTAVPEASTWAMMLIGVAGVGGVMRRRSATVAA